MKILGQKDETTTKSSYSNASTNAKLNYLENEIANLKTKVEVKGGVPRILDSGIFTGKTCSFTGPGRLVIRSISSHVRYTVDGVMFDDSSDRPLYLFSDGDGYNIPFQSSLIVDSSEGYIINFRYILYEY